MKIKKHISLKEVESPKTSDVQASIIPGLSAQRELDRLTGKSSSYGLNVYDELKNAKIIIEFFDEKNDSRRHGFDTRFIFDGNRLIIYYGRLDNYVSLTLLKNVEQLMKNVTYYVSKVETVGNIKDAAFIKQTKTFTIIQPDIIKKHNPLEKKKKDNYIYDVSFTMKKFVNNKEKSGNKTLSKVSMKLIGGNNDKTNPLYDSVVFENDKLRFEFKFNNLFSELPVNKELNAKEVNYTNKNDITKSTSLLDVKVVFDSIFKN